MRVIDRFIRHIFIFIRVLVFRKISKNIQEVSRLHRSRIHSIGNLYWDSIAWSQSLASFNVLLSRSFARCNYICELVNGRFGEARNSRTLHGDRCKWTFLAWDSVDSVRVPTRGNEEANIFHSRYRFSSFFRKVLLPFATCSFSLWAEQTVG